MKKFIIRILILFLIVYVVDWTCGHFFRYLQLHTKGGVTGRMEYIANDMTDSVLILGSSRAIHHYDPRIIIDSLGLSTYNCGKDGNGIIYNYGQYCLFRERYSPKIIIYDLIGEFDLIKKYPNERFLGGLRPYYDYKGIDSIFIEVDSLERYKMMSQIRRYNGSFISIIYNFFCSRRDDILGYIPLKDTMDYEPERNDYGERINYDTLKLTYLEKLINDTKKDRIKLIFALSPIYGGGDTAVYQYVINLAAKYEIQFINQYNDTSIIFNKQFFNDSFHLNEFGATEYTKKIVKEISNTLK